MRKKLISIIAAISMVASAVPVSFAENDTEMNTGAEVYSEYAEPENTIEEDIDDKFQIMSSTANGKDGSISWELDEKGTLYISGNGSIPDYNNTTLPPWHDYAKEIYTVSIDNSVTGIGTFAFMDCYNLTDVYLHKSLEKIGGYAFEKCYSLKSIEIPASVTEIGYNICLGCGSVNINVDKGNENYSSVDGVLFDKSQSTLIAYAKDKIQSSYDVPLNVHSMEIGAFAGCSSLTDVKLPHILGAILTGTFSNCTSLKSITLPSSLQYIVRNSFSGCTNLKNVYYCGSKAEWDSICDEIFDANVYFDEPEPDPTADEVIAAIEFDNASQTITGCKEGIWGKVTIPSKINGTEINEIGTNAFMDSNYIKNITIDGIDTIGRTAFAGCMQIEKVTINEGTTNISTGAFQNCKAIKEVYLPVSIEELTGNPFWLCDALTDIYYAGTEEEWNAINGVSSLDTKATIHYLGSDEPVDEELISKLTFDAETGTITGCDKSIAGDIVLPSKINGVVVKAIDGGAFQNCAGITSIVIPEGVTEINDNAFAGCSNLESIHLPTSITKIYETAFDNTALDYVYITDITSYANISYYHQLTIDEIFGNSRVSYSPFKQAKNLYINNVLVTEVEWPDSIEKLNNCLAGYTCIQSITIPEGVTTISSDTFEGCTGIETISLADGITGISKKAFTDTAFYNNDENWENDILYIDNYLITAKDTVSEAIIKEGTKCIADSAFLNCEALTRVTMPKGVTSICIEAFKNCVGIEEINIPIEVNYIGREAFYGCKGIEEITIPNSVTKIESGTFTNCTNLTKITLSDNLDTVYYGALNGCTALEGIYISDLEQYMNIKYKYVSSGGPVIIVKRNENSDYGPFSSVPNLYINGALAENIVIPHDIVAVSNALEGYTCIKSVEIPDNVTEIKDYAFRGCANLENISIGGGVTKIGNYVFYNCQALKTIELPDNIQSIGEEIFKNCESLSNISIEDGISGINAGLFADTAYYKNEANWSDGILYIDNYLISGDKEITAANIKDGTKYIVNNAFSGCSKLESLNISDSVENIGTYAFNNCSVLKSVTIGAGTSSIDNYAFNGCSSLTAIEIPDNVTTLGSDVFENCTTLQSVKIGSGITTLPDKIFYGCEALKSIEVPVNVTTIGNSIFDNCTNLTDIYYPGTEEQWQLIDGYKNIPSEITVHYESAKPVETIASGDDENVSWNVKDNGVLVVAPKNGGEISKTPWQDYSGAIKEVTIEEGVTEIAEGAFSGSTNLERVNLPSTLTSIPARTFENCTSLEDANIPENTESIGEYAYYNCVNLTIVIIPKGVKSIGECAFADCRKLTEITVDADNPYYSTDNGALLNKNKTEFIQYPAGRTATSYTVPSTVTRMGKYAFYNCINLTIIILPEGLGGISDYAFCGCTGLKNMNVPSSAKKIGRGAFKGCSDLETVRVSNEITEIGDEAFYECQILTNFTVPNSVTSMGECVFYNCINITVIVLSDNLTEIGRQTFYNCQKLENITIPNSVTGIADEAFYGCTSLTAMSIPINITTIGRRTFRGCTALTDIKVDLKNSDYASFKGVLFNKDMSKIIKFPEGKNVDTYSIPYGVKSADEDAFYECEPTHINIPSTLKTFSAKTVDSCKNLESATIYNPEMTIEDGAFTSLPDSFTLKGYEGSTAQTYAETNNIKFEAITESDPSEGIALMDYIDGNVKFAGDISVGKDGATLLQAVFDENNVLQKIIPYAVTDLNEPQEVDDDFETGTAKFMLWGDITNMLPFAQPITE